MLGFPNHDFPLCEFVKSNIQTEGATTNILNRVPKNSDAYCFINGFQTYRATLHRNRYLRKFVIARTQRLTC